MAPELNSRGLEAAMNRHVNDLRNGRAPKPLPSSDRIKRPASETARAARGVVRGALRGFVDLAVFMFSSALVPRFVQHWWGGERLAAVQRMASLAVWVFFSGTARASRRLFFLWIAHVSASAYFRRQQFLTDREEEQLPRVRALYRKFRLKTAELELAKTRARAAGGGGGRRGASGGVGGRRGAGRAASPGASGGVGGRRARRRAAAARGPGG
jgi:uncharacterized membrane protein YgcG